MWRANCAHFGASLSAAENEELWRRITDPDNPVGALVCGGSRAEDTLVGFVHYVLIPTHSAIDWFATSKISGSSRPTVVPE
jgi:hypothetical protein